MKTAFLALMLTTAAAKAGDCAAEWAAATGMMDQLSLQYSVAAGPVARGDACVVEGLYVTQHGEYQPDTSIASLTWSGAGLEGLFDLSVPPTALNLQVQDFRIKVKSPDRVMGYLLDRQLAVNSIDADLALRWEAGSQELIIARADLDFAGDNAVRLAGRIGGVDLRNMGAAQMSVTRFGITQLHAEVTSHGLFETYFMMPLGFLLLNADTDPAAQVAALKQGAAAGIAGLPEASFDSATKDALLTVLGEMPNPQGQLVIDLVSENGLGPAQAMTFVAMGVPMTVAGFDHILKSIKVSASYTPTPVE